MLRWLFKILSLLSTWRAIKKGPRALGMRYVRRGLHRKVGGLR